MIRYLAYIFVSCLSLGWGGCSGDSGTTAAAISVESDGEVAGDAETAQDGCLVDECPGGDACKIAICDPVTEACSFQYVEAGTVCDDNNACTSGDQCNGSGICSSATTVECDDGDPCTENNCSVETGCVHPPSDDGSPCSDGNPCTVQDNCSGGSCVGAPLQCDESDNPCEVPGGCDPTTGECQVTVLADGSLCTDGNACTTGTTCLEGTCSGGEDTNCNDDNVCTTDTCSPKSGCVNGPNNDPCSDGSVCGTGYL